VEALGLEREREQWETFLLACVLSVLLLAVSARKAFWLFVCAFAVIPSCLLASYFSFQLAFGWECLKKATSLAVTHTFSTSFPAVGRDVAIFLYIALRRWRAGGLLEMRKYLQSVKDAAVAIVAAFILVSLYHSSVTVPMGIKAESDALATPAIPIGVIPHLRPPSSALDNAPNEKPLAVQVTSDIVARIHMRGILPQPPATQGITEPQFQELFYECKLTLKPTAELTDVTITIKDETTHEGETMKYLPTNAVISGPSPGWMSGFQESREPDFYLRTIRFASIEKGEPVNVEIRVVS
jgi:hypothetical protein